MCVWCCAGVTCVCVWPAGQQASGVKINVNMGVKINVNIHIINAWYCAGVVGMC